MASNGVISIGFDYREELEKACKEIEDKIGQVEATPNISEKFLEECKKARQAIADLKAETNGAFREISKGKLDTNKFNSFKQVVNKKFQEVDKEIDNLNVSVDSLNKLLGVSGNNVDMSGAVGQFKDLLQYVNANNDAVEKLMSLIGKVGGENVVEFKVPTDNLRDLQNYKSKIEELLKSSTEMLKINDMDDKSIESFKKQFSSMIQEYDNLINKREELETKLDGMNIGDPLYSDTQKDLVVTELQLQKFATKVFSYIQLAEENSIDWKKITDAKDLNIWSENILSELDSVEAKAKKTLDEINTIIQQKQGSNVTVSDKIDANTAKVGIQMYISTKDSTLKQQLIDKLDKLGDYLKTNPIQVPIKMVLTETPVKTDKPLETSKNYLNNIEKRLEVDPDKINKNTYKRILLEAENAAKESIEKIQEIFESSPINVHLQVSEEDISKISNAVLTGDGESKIDLTGQVAKTQKKVKELNDDLKECQKVIKDTDIPKATLTNIDDLSKEFDRIIEQFQIVEKTLANGFGISSITEIEEQWKAVEKIINNSVKVNGEFRKNANVDKIIAQYQKYLDMGGTNDIASLSKLKGNEETIQRIVSGIKQISNTNIDNGSVESLSVDLSSVLDKFDNLYNLIKDIGNTFWKMMKESSFDTSVSDIEKQWADLQKYTKSISDENGKINLNKQRKEVQLLIEEYQKYVEMGGKNPLSALSDNEQTIAKLERKYAELNEEQSVDNSASIENEAKSVEKVNEAVDKLTTAIGDTKVQAINTEATAMEDAAEREVQAISAIADNVDILKDKISNVGGIDLSLSESNKTNLLSGNDNAIEQQVKQWREYDDAVSVGYDRVKKLQIITQSGTTGQNSVYDLLRLNHDAWDEVKANNFFNTIPEQGLKRYEKIFEVVQNIVNKMLEAKGLTEDQVVSQLKDIKNASGGNFKSNGQDSGWTHFATYTGSNKDQMQKVNGLTYKVYAAFDDIEDLNQNVVSSIMEELTKAGFKGRLKTTSGSTSFGDKLNGLAITDQMVIHGSTKKDQEIAYNTLKNMGLNLSYLSGGIDTPDGSFSQTLQSGNIEKYIKIIREEATTAEQTAESERKLSEARSESASQTPIKDVFNSEASSTSSNSNANTNDNTSSTEQTIKNLNTLISRLKEFDESKVAPLERVKDALVEINPLTNIPEIFNGIKVTDKQATALEVLATSLTAINESLKKIDEDSSGSSFLSQITEITKQADALSDLAKILKESKAKIKEAGKAAGADSTAQAVDKENQKFKETKETASAAAKAKGEFADANERAASTALVTEENVAGELKQMTELSTVTLDSTSEEFKNIHDWAQKYCSDLGEIASITRNIGTYTNKKGDTTLKTSYVLTDINGSSRTVNPQGDLLGAKDIINVVKEYETYLKTMDKVYALQQKVAKGTATERDTSDLVKYSQDLEESQNRINILEEKGLAISELQEEIDRRRIANSESIQKIYDNNLISEQDNLTKQIQSVYDEYEKLLNAKQKLEIKQAKGVAGDDDIYALEKNGNALKDVYSKIRDLKTNIIKGSEQEAAIEERQLKINQQIAVNKRTLADTISQSKISEQTKLVTDFENAYKRLDQFKGDRSPIFSSGMDKIKGYLETLNELKNVSVDNMSEKELSDWTNAKEKIAEVIAKMNELDNSEKGSKEVSRATMLEKVTKVYKENSRYSAEAKARLKEMINLLNDDSAVVNVSKIKTELSQIVSKEELAGRAGKNFLDVLKEKTWFNNISSLASQLFSWYSIFAKLKEAATEVKELDTALTEMRKVSDESLSTLKAYQQESFDTADAVGTTALDLQDATASYMRLGESLDEASESAKDATILMNVSEFDSIDEATESLIAMSQAYDDLDKMDIINKLNQVGNNYSISTDEAASALQKSASALKTAGNNMDEALALVTAGELNIA